MIKLKRCPVCGGRAVLVCECHGIELEPVYYVTCRGEHRKEIELYADPHRAAREWNGESDERDTTGDGIAVPSHSQDDDTE